MTPTESSRDRRSFIRSFLRLSLIAAASTLALAIALPGAARGAEEPASSFRAGAAACDITPPPGLPMWGYGARKDIPSQGVLEPLEASAVVLEVNATRLALVGLDLGRSPPRASMKVIRDRVRREAGVEHVMLIGSHTHHGPCIELEKTGPTARYVEELREKLARVIVEAAGALRPAKIAVVSGEVDRNRNRHSKISPKPVDRRLGVIYLEGTDGQPIATLVNFAAHPTTLPARLLKYSPDFPGPLRRHVEKKLGGRCVFLQGAAGDLSTDRRGKDTRAYGEALGEDVVRLLQDVRAEVPAAPSLQVREEEFRFTPRIHLEDPVTYLMYCAAFFKDLVDHYKEEYADGVRPNITVALLNGDIGLVGASGEFFCSHALRLRSRARLEHLFFFGYANGYHQYFPTIEAVAEGGYGADKAVAPVEVGGGERMMDRALFHLFDMRKKIE